MKKFLACIALLGASLSAQAADLPVKELYRKAPVVAVYDWTGLYFGVNAGVGLGRDSTLLTLPTFSFESNYQSPQGGLGGAQVGYNWQTPSVLGPLVFGVEADIQGTNLRDNYSCLLGCSSFQNAQYDQKLDWFGTVRGRLGLASGPVLGYVTGGAAFGGVRTSVSETFVFGGGSAAFSTSRTQAGWTVGSGVEAVLGGNWTGKIEYLYLNLGNKADAFTAFGGPQLLEGEVRENIFRVGLNYRIGGNSVYTPAVAANWTGFYLGGNIGSGTARDRSSVGFVGGTPELFNLAPDGINGGVQAGYNWQAANLVFGLETDIQGSSQRDNKTCVLFCEPNASFDAFDAKLPWFGTVRGRLGYSVGSTLFYATGGYAYGSIKTSMSLQSMGGTGTTQFSSTKGGWTAGAGIETPVTLLGLLGPNWTSKTEYLYVDLGSVSYPFNSGPLLGTFTTGVTEHIFRTGLNYHFNSLVVAKY
jgi:outer membrane immunogenic protein